MFWLAYWSFLFSLPIVKPKAASAKKSALLYRFNVFAFASLCFALSIFKLPPAFTLTSLSDTTFFAFDVCILATLNIYVAPAETLLLTTPLNIAVVINISSLGGQETFGFLVGFVELFVVFILIGNIDVATCCSKAGLTFLTGKGCCLS